MSFTETTRRVAALRPLLGALTGCVAVWGLVLAAGWSSLTAYGFRCEVASEGTPAKWPAGSRIARCADRRLLVVFLHPKCPCSHATISELERMLVPQLHDADRGPDVAIVACMPPALTDPWLRTSLMQRAARLPRAKVYADAGGVEAARFAATTSGEIVLVGAGGERLYAGGVTQSRGHVGGNVGADTVARLLRGESETGVALPALGCRLVRDAGRASSDRGRSVITCTGIKS